ncbi:MAG: hypothetical protein WBN30_03130 [Polyangiales bacterium]
MSTQPRMSAPIGRLKIRPSARKRVASSIGRVQAAETPCDAQADETSVPEEQSALPHYYPFAPRLCDDGED